MKNTTLLQTLLATLAIIVLGYTVLAFKDEGPDLLSIFIANIQSLTWNGQFNLDFASYLILSGLWIMWRNKFTLSSVVFGIIASVLGIILFAPYLLYLLKKDNGNLKKVLIGER